MLLETKRLILREFTPNDLEQLHEILSDPESMQHYPNPFTLEQSQSWITWNLKNYQAYGFGLWAVILKENGQFIGDCGITMQPINDKLEPEIGYHINKHYEGHGYATEVAQACKTYAFDVLQLNTISSYMEPSNRASQRVAEKNGLRQVPDTNDGKKVYALTREEYLANK